MSTQTFHQHPIIYLNENGFCIILSFCHSVDGGERDFKSCLQPHLDSDPLLLLGYDESGEVFGVQFELRVLESVQRGDVRQLPLVLHQKGQLLCVHFTLQ